MLSCRPALLANKGFDGFYPHMLLLWFYLKSTERSSLQKEVSPLELFMSRMCPFRPGVHRYTHIYLSKVPRHREQDRSSKETHMKDSSCQRFPLRRALFRLVAIMMIVPTLFLSFGSLIPGTAQAHSLASNISPQGHIDVKPAVKHDVSPPLRSIKAVHNAVARQHPLLHLPKLRQGAPNGIHDHVQHARGSTAAPSPSNNFDGVGNGFTGPQGTFTVNSAPPDTNGSVGPQDYVQIVNTDFAVFNKDNSRGAVGTVRFGPVQINTLWSGFGGNCQADNDGDPIVMYDSIANRWLITQFAVTNPNPNFLQCIAVSTGSDPTGSYNRYSF